MPTLLSFLDSPGWRWTSKTLQMPFIEWINTHSMSSRQTLCNDSTALMESAEFSADFQAECQSNTGMFCLLIPPKYHTEVRTVTPSHGNLLRPNIMSNIHLIMFLPNMTQTCEGRWSSTTPRLVPQKFISILDFLFSACVLCCESSTAWGCSKAGGERSHKHYQRNCNWS